MKDNLSNTKEFVELLVSMRESLDTDSIYYPPVRISHYLTREQYAHEIRKLQNAKKFRGNYLPRDVYDYGWNIARFKPQKWIVDRVLFWLYAYDKTHIWTKKDFDYNVNEKAYQKAKEHRKQVREKNKELALKIHNKPRPIPEPETSWEECSPPPMDQIRRLMDELSKQDK